jgi:hypothetical protein
VIAAIPWQAMARGGPRQKGTMRMNPKQKGAEALQATGAVESAPEPDNPEGGAAVQAALAPLRGLLERGDQEGARRLVNGLLERWPDSPRLQHLARVLAPPTTRLRPDIPPSDRSRERAWLRAHAHEYPGCWIAVLGDQLVAADRELQVVVSKMDQDPALKNAILYFAGRDPE